MLQGSCVGGGTTCSHRREELGHERVPAQFSRIVEVAQQVPRSTVRRSRRISARHQIRLERWVPVLSICSTSQSGSNGLAYTRTAQQYRTVGTECNTEHAPA